VSAAIDEDNPRTDNQVLDRPGHQDLPWTGHSCDSRAQMHGQTGEIGAYGLAFAGVNADTHLEPQRAHTGYDRPCTSDGAGRPVEGPEEAVTSCGDLPPFMARKFLADQGVMTLKQFAPLSVT
jgi:hypothetical protein